MVSVIIWNAGPTIRQLLDFPAPEPRRLRIVKVEDLNFEVRLVTEFLVAKVVLQGEK